MGTKYILNISCPDTIGIVAAVSSFLKERKCNILDSQQFGDTDQFFMRLCFQTESNFSIESFQKEFEIIAQDFSMNWAVHTMSDKPRMLIMVSALGHCLNDLLYRYRAGSLPVSIPAIISNHPDFEELAQWHGIPFYHLPITQETKQAQEQQILTIIREQKIDVVILARYMQILSAAFCKQLEGRIINIHHSFLPGFKGAGPYKQAFDRGVKLIGATAHYVTEDLDEGPIIEQEVERVSHNLSPTELAAVGRDIECVTLARAVKYHLEHRVFLNGRKTVVFR